MLKSSNFTSRFYPWSPPNSQSDVATPRNSAKPPYKWLVPFSNWPPKPPNLKNFDDPHPQIPQEASPAFHRLIPYPLLQSKRPRWNQTVTLEQPNQKGKKEKQMVAQKKKIKLKRHHLRKVSESSDCPRNSLSNDDTSSANSHSTSNSIIRNFHSQTPHTNIYYKKKELITS